MQIFDANFLNITKSWRTFTLSKQYQSIETALPLHY